MRIILIILILVAALGAGYFVLQSSQAPKEEVAPEAAQPPKIEAVDVLVARVVVPVGTVITEDMVDRQPWPKHLVLDGFLVAGTPEANVIGMVTRSELQVQEPLSKYNLANPNDANYIAAALPEGKRALTLRVDAITGVGGYIYPGDRVDVVLTHRIPLDLAKDDQRQSQGASVEAGFAETILDNIRILAVEIRGLDSFKNTAEQKQEPRAPTNITVEVDPEQAQAIRLAERNGSVSLVLRPLKDKEESKVVGTELKDLTGEKVSTNNTNDEVYIIRGVKSDASIVPPSYMQQGGQPVMVHTE